MRCGAAYVGPPTPLLPLDTAAVPVLQLVLKPVALRILSLLGVTDFLEQKGDIPLQMPGVHVAYDGPDATIYANDNALPRTWLVGSEQVVEGDQAQLTAIGSAGFDPRRVLIAGQRLSWLAQSGPGSSPGPSLDSSPGPSPGSAHITDYGAEQVTIDAHADRSSELVLSDTYYPGWKVTVNGRAGPDRRGRLPATRRARSCRQRPDRVHVRSPEFHGRLDRQSGRRGGSDRSGDTGPPQAARPRSSAACGHAVRASLNTQSGTACGGPPRHDCSLVQRSNSPSVIVRSRSGCSTSDHTQASS